ENATNALASRAFLRSACTLGTEATQAGRGVQTTVVMSSTRSAVVGASTLTATGSGIFGSAGAVGDGTGVALGEGAVVSGVVGARLAGDERDLAHVLARPASRDLPRADQDPQRAGHDDEEVVAALALARERGAVRAQLLRRYLSDLLQLGGRQRREEWDLPQEQDLLQQRERVERPHRRASV